MLAPRRLDPGKPVGRRSLILMPHRAAVRRINGPILVRPEDCAGARACSLCTTLCPTRALAGKPPQLDPYKCSECLACVKACPLEALTAPGTPPGMLEGLARASGARILVVAERRSGPTLSGLRPPIPALVWLLPTLEALSDAEAARAAAGGARLVAVGPPSPGLEALERRGLILRVEDPEGIPWTPMEPPPIPRGPASWPLRGALEVDPEKCTLCGACARACPTGALALAQDGAGILLEWDPEKCRGCTLCEQRCPEQAITCTATLAPPARARRVLARSPPAACARCGRPLNIPRALARRVQERSGAPLLCPECRRRRMLERLLDSFQDAPAP